ncbi:MAG: ATP-binding protein [Sphingobium sp.]
MKLMIERPYVDALVEAWPELSPLSEQLRFGERAEVPVAQLTAEQCAHLGTLFRKGGPEMQLRAAQLATLRAVLDEGGRRFTPNDLEDFLAALLRYLLAGGIRGWVFSADVSRRPLPYVVTRIDYTPTNNEESGKVFLELKANAKGSLVTNVIRVTASDIDGRTVGEVFVAKGFLKETPELIGAYDATASRYFDWRGRYGEQFSAAGRAFYAEDPTSPRRDTDWARKDVVVLSASGGKARLVNDEGILTERALTLDVPGEILGSYLRRAAKSNQYDNEDEVRALAETIPAGMFTAIPVHALVLMFHLDLHHYVWVHVDDMEPYAYQPALKQKLVLPPEQTDLIDILTAEMDVLMDDIVEGKSGGTTVLCAGPAGVGKTLTAEVYSEIIRRPLYRVHSGQLGLNVAQMEGALKDVLTRAQRWGAVMLIDEADVYIKRRDDDMTMNAVVGVFLRVLEYFNGLLFLTTNRVDDIDEAIVSRCIALIKYHAPDAEGRRRIWQVMVEQFGLAVDDALISELAEVFPHATGRDIKGLTKLVAKYCSQKQVPPTLEAFQRCSMFRGMDIAIPAAAQGVAEPCS